MTFSLNIGKSRRIDNQKADYRNLGSELIFFITYHRQIEKPVIALNDSQK